MHMLYCVIPQLCSSFNTIHATLFFYSLFKKKKKQPCQLSLKFSTCDLNAQLFWD